MTSIVAVISDTHCGGSTALTCPDTLIEDGGEYKLNAIQHWLYYNCWLDYWKKITTLRKAYKRSKLWVILNGDLVEGNHHGSTQIVSPNMRIMKDIAIATLEPHVKSSDYLFVTKGTESHVGASGVWDDIIADELGAIADESSNSPAWWWLELDVEGIHFAFSHHGRTGMRPWTKSTGARTLAASLTFKYYNDYRQAPPQVAVFSHVHRFTDSGLNYPVHVWTTGCWQLSTGFGHKIAPGMPPEIGGMVFVIKDGEILNNDPRIRYIPRKIDKWQPTK